MTRAAEALSCANISYLLKTKTFISYRCLSDDCQSERVRILTTQTPGAQIRTVDAC